MVTTVVMMIIIIAGFWSLHSPPTQVSHVYVAPPHRVMEKIKHPVCFMLNQRQQHFFFLCSVKTR